MYLFPAIDLLGGQAVRLEKGRFDRVTVYDPDPISRAVRMRDEGSTHLHLVDLDGARSGETVNLPVVEEIARTGLFLELGGGIRSMETIERYLSLGVSRVILGTAAAEDDAFLQNALSAFGPKVAVGVDLLDGFVAVRGWEEKSRWTASDFFAHLGELGVRTVICTDISRDGILTGSNHELYADLLRSYPLDLIASGGVRDLDDLRGLARLGMAGAIIGRACYSGAISLRDAFREFPGERSQTC